jgi:hypothetical protein
LVAQTLDALKDLKATKSQKPRFLFATDGREVSTLDLKTDETLRCDFAKLNDHFDFFLPLAGIDKYEAVKENPADIKATGRLGRCQFNPSVPFLFDDKFSQDQRRRHRRRIGGFGDCRLAR